MSGERDRTPVVGKWDGEPSIVGKKSLSQVASFKNVFPFCGNVLPLLGKKKKRREKSTIEGGVTDEEIMEGREALEEMEGG